MKKNGLSLVEILTTLILVGTIATLSISTIVTVHSKRTRVSQLQKAYNTLWQTLKGAEIKYGPASSWLKDVSKETPAGLIVATKFDTILRTVDKNYIETSDATGDFGIDNKKYKFKDSWNNNFEENIEKFVTSDKNEEKLNEILSSKNSNSPAKMPSYKTEDGTIFIIDSNPVEVNNNSNESAQNDKKYYIEILTILPNKLNFKCKTTNGSRACPLLGYDMFSFFLDFQNNIIVPAGQQAHEFAKQFDIKSKGSTAWIILNQNFAHRECPTKVDWNGCTSCKEAATGKCDEAEGYKIEITQN